MSLQLDYYVVSERWALSDVKAVFSRRYLHQNKALEIFFANRCKHTFHMYNKGSLVPRLPFTPECDW